ncbi:hypothetical protein D623_10024576 [Myotis brandtii]|uniref:Uncharacterized protein n=1 Tax=Myotis brandtii TaxID=109478 RepID=S7NIV0_MYOBR|nr:hypothetical protein D623_10024576 [Myotis brandtii]
MQPTVTKAVRGLAAIGSQQVLCGPPGACVRGLLRHVRQPQLQATLGLPTPGSRDPSRDIRFHRYAGGTSDWPVRTESIVSPSLVLGADGDVSLLSGLRSGQALELSEQLDTGSEGSELSREEQLGVLGGWTPACMRGLSD